MECVILSPSLYLAGATRLLSVGSDRLLTANIRRAKGTAVTSAKAVRVKAVNPVISQNERL